MHLAYVLAKLIIHVKGEPSQKINEVLLRHFVRQQPWHCPNTHTEQIDLWLSLSTAISHDHDISHNVKAAP